MDVEKKRSRAGAASGRGDEAALRQDQLGQLRLLVVLDALLREGSVQGAAASLGLQSPAVSRLLAQLRGLYGDPLFIRTAKGLLPTPFAEALRQRVRLLSADVESLMTPPPATGEAIAPAARQSWEEGRPVGIVPLSTRPGTLLMGEPAPLDIARNLDAIDADAEPQRRLAKYIGMTGGGPGRSRPLTGAEAEDAMAIILSGEAASIQIGALMTAIGYRGVTAAEVAGFVAAARAHAGAEPPLGEYADLDWPSYMSPRVTRPPWYLHAARLVAMAGHRVALHGYHGQGKVGGKLEVAAQAAGIPFCESLAEARAALAVHRIAYLPVEVIAPQLQAILGLYPLFQMRLPTNSIVHLLNPLGAPVSIFGVAQPSSRELHRDAAQILGTQDITILGNTRDIAEFTPFTATVIHRLAGGRAFDTHVPSRKPPEKTPRPAAYGSREYWQAVWDGAARDATAETIILSTAAAALLALDRSAALGFEEACAQAAALWRSR